MHDLIRILPGLPRTLFFRHRFAGPPLAALLLCVLLLPLAACQREDTVEQLVAKATTLHDSGDFPGAIGSLNAALAKNPRSIPALILAAQIYIDLGRGDPAIGTLLHAQQDGAGERDLIRARAEASLVAHRYTDVIDMTAAPPAGLPVAIQASLLAYRGAALTAQGRDAEARAALEQGLALDPHSVEMRLATGRLALDGGKLDEARRELAEAYRTAPKDRRLRQLEGDIAYAAQDYAAAEKTYQKIVDLEPWNQVALGLLASAEVAQDKLSEAAARLDAVLLDPNLAEVPKHPILSQVRALAAFRQHDYAVAQAYAENVLANVPDFESARLLAGASSYALHEYERAFYYLSPYVGLNPDDVTARKLLASIQLQLARPADAAKTLAALRGKAPEDPELLTLIGIASARAGDIAEANRFLGLALEQHRDNAPLRMELGITEIAIGNPKAGIENLQQVVKAHPNAAEPQMALFAGLMKTGAYDRALAVAQQVIKSEPNAATGHMLAMAVYLTKGDFEAGRAALLKARELRPDDVEPNLNLSKLAVAEGKLDEARGYLRDILNANPQYSDGYLAIAELDLRDRREDEAEAVLLEGVRANPEVAALAAGLLKLQLARGKAKDVAADADRALKKFPRNPVLLDIVGHARLALGDNDGALSTFRDLVQVAPESAVAHADLAEAYLAHYTPDSPQWPAINEATEAVRLDPQSREAKLILARALTTHGRFADARELVDQLQKDGEPDLATIELDGLVARGLGNPAAAAAAFTRATTLHDNAVDRRRLADTQVQLGHIDDALATLNAWLDAHPQDGETRKLLADLYVKADRLAAAGEQYAALLQQQPDNAAVRNNLAWLLYRQGKPQEALARAREALALAPDSADVRDTLGLVLLQSGDAGEAVDQLEPAWQEHAERLDIGFHLSQALAAAGRGGEARAVLQRLLTGKRPFTERAQAQELLQQLGG